MCKRLYFLIFLTSFPVLGQSAINGRVIDSYNKSTLAFANITFNDDPSMHTTTDIDGKFTYFSKKTITHLSCSYIGYDSVKIEVLAKQDDIIIQLVTAVNPLQEIVIDSENPANRIIRKVIENKKTNNPENITSFRYRSYNKSTYDFTSNKADKTDSLALRNIFGGGHVFLMESVTERKFIKPDLSEEVVLATKVSGFKNPSFASLATDLQPFSFYQDNIKLLNVYYLNPISDNSLKKYFFKLEETILREKDSVFIVSFHPKKGKNFDGLRGVLYINSNKYAVQNVIAYPAEKGKVNLKIQQQYQLVNEYWFPEQLNYSLTFSEYPNKDIGMVAQGKSYISDVETNIHLVKKEFTATTIRIAEGAAAKDAAFWNFQRKNPLTPIEHKTYKVLDSIGAANHFDSYLSGLEKLAQNKLQISFLDLDLSKTLTANQYESIRLGTGLYTNEKVFKKLTLGGFFGYGIKDNTWKYGAEATYWISKEKESSINIRHQNNLIETGNNGMLLYNKRLFNLRSVIGYQFDNIIQNTISANFSAFDYLKFTLAFNQTDVKPLYTYQFQPNSYTSITNYKNTNASVFLRFAYKEKIVRSFNSSYSYGSKYPILYLYFSKGIKDMAASQFDYNKIEFAAEHSFYTTNFGLTKYRIEAGLVDKNVPLGLLFTGEGSYDNEYPYTTKNTFQTMEPYAFLSDRYANLFLSHDFGGLLFKASSFQPSVALHNNIGWGSLSNSDYHKGIAFNTKEKVYLETGLQLGSLLKLNCANLGYLGVGAGVFYRYGYYAKPDLNDNLAYKLVLSYSIK